MNFEVVLNQQLVTHLCSSLCQNFLGVATQNIEDKTCNLVIYAVPFFRILFMVQSAHENTIKCISFTPNSKLLVSCGCDHQVKFWQNSKCIWSLTEIEHPQKISIENNGEYLACGNYIGQAFVWNIIKRQIVSKFQAQKGSVQSLQFSHRNDRLLLISGNSKKYCEHLNESKTQEDQELNLAQLESQMGVLSIWNWYEKEKLFSLEDALSQNILSLFSSQWLFVCKTDIGQVEVYNVGQDENFENAKVDVKLQFPKGVSLTDICLSHHTNFVVCTNNNQIVHNIFQEEIVTKNHGFDGSIINSERSAQDTITISNQSTTDIMSLDHDNFQQIKIKLINQETIQLEAKIRSTIFIGQKIMMATSDGILNWTENMKDLFPRFGTAGRVLTIKFNPNGRLLAAGDENGFILLSNVETKATISQTKGHASKIDFLSFLDDDQIISKGKDNQIKIWQIDGSKLILLKSLQHSSFTDVRVSDNNQYLLIGNNDGSLNVFNTIDWSCIIVQDTDVEITAVAFAQNSNYIISANLNKSISIIDFKSKLLIKKLEGHQDPIIALAGSPTESQFASGGYDCMIKIWSIPQQCLLSTLIGHQECVNAIKYSNNGNILFSSSEDKTIRIWSLDKMKVIMVLDAGDDNIVGFDLFAETGLMAYTQHDQVVLQYGQQQPVKFQSQQQEKQISAALCWSKEQDCLAYSSEFQVRFLIGEQEIRIPLVCDQKVKSLEIHHKRIYVTCEESLIQIFHDGQLLRKIQQIDCIACTINNTFYITGSQKEVIVWNCDDFEKLKVFDQEWVTLIVIGRHKLIAACCDIQGVVQVWDIANSRSTMKQLAFSDSKIQAACFAQLDDSIVCAGENGQISMFKIQSPENCFSFFGHVGNIYSIVLTDDEKNLLSGGEDGTIKYWNIATQQMMHILAVHKHPITAIAIKNSTIAYRFGNITALLDAPQDIITNIQVQAGDCGALMQIQDLQLQSQNSVLSRQLGTIFRTKLRKTLVQDEQLSFGMQYLNEETLKKSAFYEKIRSDIVNPKLRDNLLDQFTQSDFLLQSFDESLGYAIFNETFEMLRELNYEYTGKLVQNMFYTVVNNQTVQGTRILHEILKQQKFSSNLSMKELQYLLALIKFLKCHIKLLHDPTKYQIQLKKIIGIKDLNLAKNAYLSSILCKSLLLQSMDKTFEKFRLISPQEMFQNEQFNLYKNGDFLPQCYDRGRGDRIQQQISKITDLRDQIADFQVDEYDNFIQDFILELLQEFEQLEHIDLSFLNLTDEFCEQFCNNNIDKQFAPDLSIQSNERITYVGKKYLQVMYTKHKFSSLTVQNVIQMKNMNDSLKDKLKLIRLGKFKKTFSKGYKSQIELVVADLTQLQKSVQEKLQSLDTQENLLLNIEDYYEQQCEKLKRQQVLLNQGVLGYVNEALFNTNQIHYCSFCNKYVCVSCHDRPHQSSDLCILCLKCFQYHRGLQEILECKLEQGFSYQKQKLDLYQKFKFQDRGTKVVCFYGSLVCLKKIEKDKRSFLAHFNFRFNIQLYKFIRFLTTIVELPHIIIANNLRKLKGKKKHLSPEEMKSVVFESLQVLAEDQYNFNTNVFDLEDYLQPNCFIIICMIQFVTWYAISISLPILLPGVYTAQWTAHFIFSGYLAFTLLLEFSAIRIMIKIINRSLEGEIKLMGELASLRYINFLIMSVLAKYDYYTKVIFACILHRQSEKQNQFQIQVLFYSSLAFIIFPSLINILQTTYFVSREISFRYSKSRLTKNKTLRLINFYSKLSYLIEAEALAWFFDLFASNTAVKIGHRYVPQKMLTSFFKVTFNNMPQLIIQLFYQIEIAKDYNTTLIFTTLTTCVSLLVQILNFMSAKSSPINEIEFLKMQQRLGTQSLFIQRYQCFETSLKHYSWSTKASVKHQKFHSLNINLLKISEFDSVDLTINKQQGQEIELTNTRTSIIDKNI